ncbi:hypothetical protein C8R43DRAFT_1045800 [Mycena crocata]|nr:hypothetical protein C8R43DRAFT_1045800 [Mycena crocata]
MHPALHISNLRRLPALHKKRALAAANGSFVDLLYIYRNVDRSLPLFCLLLPAFYVHLDPVKVEDLESRDVLSSVDLKAIEMAAIAIEALDEMDGIPPDSMQEIWPNLWRWAQLVMQHDYCLSYLVDYSTGNMNRPILAVITKFLNAKAATESIEAEPGVRILAAKTWASLSKGRWTSKRGAGTLTTVWTFLRAGVDASNLRHHEELVEGCGGTLRHLAYVLLSTLARLPTENRKNLNFFLANSSIFIEKTELLRPEFSGELVSQGFVRTFTRILCDLNACEGPMTREPLQSCFLLLVNKIRIAPGYTRVVEALDAGFLRLIVAAVINPQLLDGRVLAHALTITLGHHLVYHSVLSKLQAPMAEALYLADAKAPRTSPVWEQWKTFTSLVSNRLKVLEYYESGQYLSIRACDNGECSNVSGGSKLRRCATCQSVCYCCAGCQATDWRRGHRDFCDEIRQHWLRNPDLASPRDRSFFRCVLERLAYCSKDIFIKELLYMNARPGEVFFTEFTDVGTFTFACLGTTATNWMDMLGPIAQDSMARAHASRGRLRLLILHISEGSRMRTRLISLRERSLVLREGLARLASEFPAGTTEAQLRDDFPHILVELEALIQTDCQVAVEMQVSHAIS